MAFVTVTGKVARSFHNGKGAEIVESFEAGGKQIEKRWTAWFDAPHGLEDGSQTEVSGIHSDEINSWEKDGEKKYSVKRSINKAKVKSGNPGAPVQSATEQPWAPEPDEGLPF